MKLKPTHKKVTKHSCKKMADQREEDSHENEEENEEEEDYALPISGNRWKQNHVLVLLNELREFMGIVRDPLVLTHEEFFDMLREYFMWSPEFDEREERRFQAWAKTIEKADENKKSEEQLRDSYWKTVMNSDYIYPDEKVMKKIVEILNRIVDLDPEYFYDHGIERNPNRLWLRDGPRNYVGVIFNLVIEFTTWNAAWFNRI